ncbi:MAG: protease-4 [Rickettsiales bacterium]|jgi:protease-4
MSLSSDNFTTLIHLRDQARKWKNLSFLMIVAIFLLSFRVLLGSGESQKNIDSGGDYIASINIEGIIFEDYYRSEVLEKISKQKNIKAVIVNINSPGGGIVGSEILYENLKEIKNNKPIVVVMGALAASGGYMASLASDHIIARNGTLTGSIGVIMQTSEMTELADKIGIKFLNYKSSPLKGSPSPFEKSSPQVNQVISASIKDSYEFFVELVKLGRGDRLNKKTLQIVTDGRIFTGRQALNSGLIDEIGGKKEALKYLSDVKKIDITKYPVKKIEIKENNESIIEKILGTKTMAKALEKFTGFNKNQQLMSVWSL